MEVKLSQTVDPLGYLSGVLRKVADVLETMRGSPKSSIRRLYSENAAAIDQNIRNVSLSFTSLRDSTLAVGTASHDDLGEWGEKLQEAVAKATSVAQDALILLDDLSVRYLLPDKEPVLFAKIGTVLYE